MNQKFTAICLFVYVPLYRHNEGTVSDDEATPTNTVLLLRASNSFTNRSDQYRLPDGLLLRAVWRPTRLQYFRAVAPCGTGVELFKTAVTRRMLRLYARCVFESGKLLRVFRRKQQLYKSQ